MRASPPALDPDLHHNNNNYLSQCYYYHHSMPSLTMDLDKVRSEAHRYGWRDAPYNPFGRVRSNESRSADLEQAVSTSELPTMKRAHFSSPSALGRQTDNEPPRSPTRIDTEKEENISSNTAVDGSVSGEGLLTNRLPKSDDTERLPEQSQPSRLTDSEKEEERKRKQKDLLRKKIPIGQQIKTVLFPHWYTINWLLFAAPVGIGINYAHGINPLAIFIVNFLAIIPLAGILSFSTEELSLRVGETLG